MAVTFKSWQALYLVMLDQAADFYGGKLTTAEYTVNTGGSSRQMRYRTEKEFRDGLEYVQQQAQLEASGLLASVATPIYGRTYARNGGRG